MAHIPPRKPGKKALRYGVPVAVAGVAAVTVGLVPALADTGDPELPEVTAEELVAKMAESKTDQLTGTVKVDTDLGLPSIPGMAGGGGGEEHGGMFGGGGEQAEERGDTKGGPSESPGGAPRQKLMELASGEHTLRVAADGPEKQRVSIVEDTAEYSFIHNGKDLWTYDSASDSASHTELPEKAAKGGQHEKMPDLTPQKAAKKALAAVDDTTSVSVDGTAKVADRDAYQLVIKPKADAKSTVESVRIAVDAENGTPLKFTLMPRGGGEPAVDIGYTDVDFQQPDADQFDFQPPEGTDVTREKLGAKAPELEEKFQDKFKGEGKELRSGLDGLNVLGEGWDSVVEVELPKNALGGLVSGGRSDAPQIGKLLDGFTDEVKGDFGTGRVIESELVNALITEDGKVYAGAVTKDGLVDAAEEAAK
ncbi:LolA family protein [Streptomyces oceani]|uniref:MucB/RseB N-terminal domain-containing protein n=1 Tax=Streptomyces oceani TaxID=1075402 RepID=A0A1E7KH91_9ACTN|nr:outer membrane lipoprotein carrier protein LolA [Streptomyces oceani]OEV03310.1 hypothetical protein AN216_12245 [Streptomyces oceani]